MKIFSLSFKGESLILTILPHNSLRHLETIFTRKKNTFMQKSISYEIQKINAKIYKDTIEYTQVQIHIHIQNWSKFTFS